MVRPAIIPLHGTTPAGVPEPELPPTPEAVFRRYVGYVATIALRLLGRDDEVEDVVQDVFLQTVRKLHQVRDPAALQGWLATTTVRMARRHLRRRRVRALVRIDEERDYRELADPTAMPEERALLARIYRALDGLKADQRIAWTLRHIEGEPLDSVALLCRCSLATAKRRIAAASSVLEALVSDE